MNSGKSKSDGWAEGWGQEDNIFPLLPFFLHPTGINLLAYIFLNAIQISMNLFLQVTFEPVLSGSVLRGHLCYLVKVPNFFPIVTVILSLILF